MSRSECGAGGICVGTNLCCFCTTSGPGQCTENWCANGHGGFEGYSVTAYETKPGEIARMKASEVEDLTLFPTGLPVGFLVADKYASLGLRPGHIIKKINGEFPTKEIFFAFTKQTDGEHSFIVTKDFGRTEEEIRFRIVKQ